MPTTTPKIVKRVYAYDDATRDHFVRAHFETGDLVKASKACKISYDTAKIWKKAPWFEEATKELKRAIDRQFDGRITYLLEDTIKELENRVKEGDVKAFLSKDFVIKERVPIPGKDLALIAGILFDKRKMIRDNAEFSGASEHVLDRLGNIADRLRELARMSKPEVIDVEMKGGKNEGGEVGEVGESRPASEAVSGVGGA
jgi:methylase of polypeptide subunit release factors